MGGWWHVMCYYRTSHEIKKQKINIREGFIRKKNKKVVNFHNFGPDLLPPPLVKGRFLFFQYIAWVIHLWPRMFFTISAESYCLVSEIYCKFGQTFLSYSDSDLPLLLPHLYIFFTAYLLDAKYKKIKKKLWKWKKWDDPSPENSKLFLIFFWGILPSVKDLGHASSYISLSKF